MALNLEERPETAQDIYKPSRLRKLIWNMRYIGPLVLGLGIGSALHVNIGSDDGVHTFSSTPTPETTVFPNTTLEALPTTALTTIVATTEIATTAISSPPVTETVPATTEVATTIPELTAAYEGIIPAEITDELNQIFIDTAAGIGTFHRNDFQGFGKCEIRENDTTTIVHDPFFIVGKAPHFDIKRINTVDDMANPISQPYNRININDSSNKTLTELQAFILLAIPQDNSATPNLTKLYNPDSKAVRCDLDIDITSGGLVHINSLSTVKAAGADGVENIFYAGQTNRDARDTNIDIFPETAEFKPNS